MVIILFKIKSIYLLMFYFSFCSRVFKKSAASCAWQCVLLNESLRHWLSLHFVPWLSLSIRVNSFPGEVVLLPWVVQNTRLPVSDALGTDGKDVGREVLWALQRDRGRSRPLRLQLGQRVVHEMRTKVRRLWLLFIYFLSDFRLHLLGIAPAALL